MRRPWTLPGLLGHAFRVIARGHSQPVQGHGAHRVSDCPKSPGVLGFGVAAGDSATTAGNHPFPHLSYRMLANRWNQLCENAGLDSRAGWTAIATAYGEQCRAYHNLRHIADCLHLLDEYVVLAANPVAVEIAIWFHDIVYDPRAADNEERSADMAAEFLWITPYAAMVADLIMATKHGANALNGDAALICDIDLSILGRPPAEYAAYAAAISREYAWVPPTAIRRGEEPGIERLPRSTGAFHSCGIPAALRHAGQDQHGLGNRQAGRISSLVTRRNRIPHVPKNDKLVIIEPAFERAMIQSISR